MLSAYRPGILISEAERPNFRAKRTTSNQERGIGQVLFGSLVQRRIRGSIQASRGGGTARNVKFKFIFCSR